MPPSKKSDKDEFTGQMWCTLSFLACWLPTISTCAANPLAFSTCKRLLAFVFIVNCFRCWYFCMFKKSNACCRKMIANDHTSNERIICTAFFVVCSFLAVSTCVVDGEVFQRWKWGLAACVISICGGCWGMYMFEKANNCCVRKGSMATKGRSDCAATTLTTKSGNTNKGKSSRRCYIKDLQYTYTLICSEGCESCCRERRLEKAIEEALLSIRRQECTNK